MTLHRLVAITWIPNPNSLEQVNHINRVKTDNSVENLEWCTPRHNAIHAQGGTLCHFSKLSRGAVMEIRADYVLGDKMVDLARKHRVTPDTVSQVVRWNTFDYPCP